MKRIIAVLFLVVSLFSFSGCRHTSVCNQIIDLVKEFQVQEEDVKVGEDINMDIIKGEGQVLMARRHEDITIYLSEDQELAVVYVRLEQSDRLKLKVVAVELAYKNADEKISIYIEAYYPITSGKESQTLDKKFEDFVNELNKLNVEDVKYIFKKLGYDEIS